MKPLSFRKAKKPSVNITVDENKGFYRHKDLKLDDVKYLVGEDYVQSRHWNINGKREIYLLKPRRGESLEHFFLIWNIAEHLNKISNKLELFETTKPDIVFNIGKKKYAVEVETGKVYTKDKKKFHAKIKALNQSYGNNWFFVVTNRDFAPIYGRFGKTFTRQNFLKQFEKWIKNN